jgi:hypothetical protein
MKRLLFMVTVGVVGLVSLLLVIGLLPSSLELAVEVKPLRAEPNSKYGRITITNLSKEIVTVTHVSINRSTEATCSFDPKDAAYETPVLEPGRGITVSTIASEAGLCGSILLVAIDTDKGSADYNIHWR